MSLGCNFLLPLKFLFDCIIRHVCKCVIITCNQYMLRSARALIALVSMFARSGCQEFILEREVNCSILLGQIFLYGR